MAMALVDEAEEPTDTTDVSMPVTIAIHHYYPSSRPADWLRILTNSSGRH